MFEAPQRSNSVIRDPLMKVLPFKVGETSREQTRVALNISPVAPYLGGTHVVHRRHPRRSQCVLSVDADEITPAGAKK